ncbi:hypothetical protein QS306_07015 [Paraburkholderia bonniea]|uniref:hypothetical protein n=1 Tax=Paraburkholderia bonniea TaxID=2152891 RepID=UPI002573EDC4|nr:hypothetical protein [Paraburkholderia bonniea]WJF88908.1 hypothetical protein QS306_07015 [Paraburkholderia bonniea]WJF92224.1 hypothetical protein QS308_07025 [Paraburkholderia bonniea]
MLNFSNVTVHEKYPDFYISGPNAECQQAKPLTLKERVVKALPFLKKFLGCTCTVEKPVAARATVRARLDTQDDEAARSNDGLVTREQFLQSLVRDAYLARNDRERGPQIQARLLGCLDHYVGDKTNFAAQQDADEMEQIASQLYTASLIKQRLDELSPASGPTKPINPELQEKIEEKTRALLERAQQMRAGTDDAKFWKALHSGLALMGESATALALAQAGKHLAHCQPEEMLATLAVASVRYYRLAERMGEPTAQMFLQQIESAVCSESKRIPPEVQAALAKSTDGIKLARLLTMGQVLTPGAGGGAPELTQLTALQQVARALLQGNHQVQSDAAGSSTAVLAEPEITAVIRNALSTFLTQADAFVDAGADTDPTSAQGKIQQAGAPLWELVELKSELDGLALTMTQTTTAASCAKTLKQLDEYVRKLILPQHASFRSVLLQRLAQWTRSEGNSRISFNQNNRSSLEALASKLEGMESSEAGNKKSAASPVERRAMEALKKNLEEIKRNAEFDGLNEVFEDEFWSNHSSSIKEKLQVVVPKLENLHQQVISEARQENRTEQSRDQLANKKNILDRVTLKLAEKAADDRGNLFTGELKKKALGLRLLYKMQEPDIEYALSSDLSGSQKKNSGAASYSRISIDLLPTSVQQPTDALMDLSDTIERAFASYPSSVKDEINRKDFLECFDEIVKSYVAEKYQKNNKEADYIFAQKNGKYDTAFDALNAQGILRGEVLQNLPPKYLLFKTAVEKEIGTDKSKIKIKCAMKIIAEINQLLRNEMVQSIHVTKKSSDDGVQAFNRLTPNEKEILGQQFGITPELKNNQLEIKPYVAPELTEKRDAFSPKNLVERLWGGKSDSQAREKGKLGVRVPGKNDSPDQAAEQQTPTNKSVPPARPSEVPGTSGIVDRLRSFWPRNSAVN